MHLHTHTLIYTHAYKHAHFFQRHFGYCWCKWFLGPLMVTYWWTQGEAHDFTVQKLPWQSTPADVAAEMRFVIVVWLGFLSISGDSGEKMLWLYYELDFTWNIGSSKKNIPQTRTNRTFRWNSWLCMFPIDILGNPCAISMADKLRLSSFTSNEKGSSVLARPGGPRKSCLEICGDARCPRCQC